MSRRPPDGTRSRMPTSAAPARAAPATRLRSPPADAFLRSLIMDPAVEIAELYQCQGAEHDQQHDRQCRGIGCVLEREGYFVNVIQQQRAGIAGTAFGHNDEVIDQLERVDDGVD